MSRSKMPVSRAKTAYGLLKDVKRLVLEEPLRLDMGLVLAQGEALEGLRQPACGTVGCIAGWVNVLTGVPAAQLDDTEPAEVKLGLSADQSDLLFRPLDLLWDQGQTVAHARKTARHIDKFCDRHEKQLRSKKIR